MASRVPPADHPHHRGLGRRRLGQDHRDQRARQPARRHRRHARLLLHDRQPGARCRWSALGLGSVAGLGAARLAASHYSVMTKTTRRCSSPARRWWRGWARRSSKQELGGWEIQTPRRRHRPRGRHRGGGLRLRAPLPVLPAVVGPRACRRGAAATTTRERADEMLLERRSRATAARSTRCGRSSRRWSTRARSSRWAAMFGRSIITGLARLDGLPGGAAGQRPLSLRRRLDGGRLPEGRALRRPGRDLPPAGRLSVRLPGLPDRAGGREDAPPSATACARWRRSTRRRVPWCTVIVRNAFGVAGAAHQPAGRLSLRYAWLSALLGLAAAGRRHRGRLSRRDRRAPRPQGQAGRDRGAAERAALAVPHGRDASGSRRSSTRATRARCCASSPTWPSRCARPAPRALRCGPEPTRTPNHEDPHRQRRRRRHRLEDRGRRRRHAWRRTRTC